MPEQATIQRAKKDKREGKAATTQAGEFIREEFHHVREGKHGARSPQQAIAIGLSKARRAGVELPPPKKGTVSEKTRRSAEHAYEAGRLHPKHHPSRTRSKAIMGALKREGKSAASHAALSRQAERVAHQRTASERSASAKKAARTRARHEHAGRS